MTISAEVLIAVGAPLLSAVVHLLISLNNKMTNFAIAQAAMGAQISELQRDAWGHTTGQEKVA